MLAYFYPPIRTSAVARTAGFAVNLPRHGVVPTVLTVRHPKVRSETMGEAIPDGVEVVRARELDLPGALALMQGVANRATRLLTGRNLSRNRFAEVLAIPDEHIAWLALVPGVGLARHCDCIYATCSPFSTALLGVAIKRLTGRPLILDFRDAWSMNPATQPSPYQRRLFRRLERYVLRFCDRLILNTPGAEALYRQAYPEHAAKILHIPNGFDRLTPGAPRADGTYRITHVGDFYGVRQPDQLLEVLAELNLPDIEFVQIGKPFESLDHFRGRVRMTVSGTLPREDALRHMQEASLLYLRQHDEAGAAHVAVAAKTYEYLATGLPILAHCPPGDNADLVARYARAGHVVTSGAINDLKAAVVAAYAARHDAPPGVPEEFVRTFSRPALAERLADTVRSVVTVAS